MELEQIVPAFFLIAVLVLILPGFIKTNLKSKQFVTGGILKPACNFL